MTLGGEHLKAHPKYIRVHPIQGQNLTKTISIFFSQNISFFPKRKKNTQHPPPHLRGSFQRSTPIFTVNLLDIEILIKLKIEKWTHYEKWCAQLEIRPNSD